MDTNSFTSCTVKLSIVECLSNVWHFYFTFVWIILKATLFRFQSYTTREDEHVVIFFICSGPIVISITCFLYCCTRRNFAQDVGFTSDSGTPCFFLLCKRMFQCLSFRNPAAGGKCLQVYIFSVFISTSCFYWMLKSLYRYTNSFT